MNDDLETLELEAHIHKLKNESPKLDESLKNLISIVLGTSLTSSDTDLLSGTIQYTPSIALHCAKVILKGISNYKIEEYLSWSAARPQAQEQSGISRLDDLNKYKALLFLKTRVISSKQSINKFFGKSYLTWSQQWNDIRSYIESLDEFSKIPPDHSRHFLDLFETSLNDQNDIIWSIDFKNEVYNRSKNRRQSVNTRAAEVKESELMNKDNEAEDGNKVSFGTGSEADLNIKNIDP